MNKKYISTLLLASISGILVLSSCSKKGCMNENAINYDSEAKKDDGSCEFPEEEENTTDLSTIKSKFYGSNVTFSVNNESIIITTNNEPDHKSMYFPSNHALYEDYDNSADDPDFFKNPNEISAQNYVFTIPRYPAEATSKTSTDYDAIGVCLNGVVLYNQVAAPGDDIMDELHSFDQWSGHPTQGGNYHHHTEPTYLTSTLGDDALIGVLLDGFPVYGPKEDGKTISNSDLDDYHGHFGVTTEFPDGIYHYHITNDLPWINGGKYYGKAGSFTN